MLSSLEMVSSEVNKMNNSLEMTGLVNVSEEVDIHP